MNRLLAAGRDTCAGRRTWPAAFGAGLTAVLAVPVPASSQTVSDVQRELNQMKQQYEAELRRMRQDYDARLRRLETRLKAAESHPPATAKAVPATKEVPVAAADTAPPPPPAPNTVAAAPATPLVVAPPAAGAKPFDRVHDRHAAGRTLGRWSGRAAPRRVGRRIQSGDRRHAGRHGRISLSQNPNNYFVQGFPAGRRYQSGRAGIVAVRKRGEFSGQRRPVSVRQPDALDIAG